MRRALITLASAIAVNVVVLGFLYLLLAHEAEIRWRDRCEQAMYTTAKMPDLVLRQCIYIWSRN